MKAKKRKAKARTFWIMPSFAFTTKKECREYCSDNIEIIKVTEQPKRRNKKCK